MKKFFLIILSVLCLFSVTAILGCNKTQTITVTFKQDGYEDVIVYLNSGETVKNVPTPQDKIGYKVVWDRTDFSNITENTVVNACKTAKTYKVNFNLLGGSLVDENNQPITQTTFTYTYDQEYKLPSVIREGYTFEGYYAWKMRVPNQDISLIYSQIDSQGVWNICNEKNEVCEITLFATWSYKIIFRQQGYDDVVLTYTQTPNGSTAIKESDIPNPQSETGYDVTWKSFNISNLTKDTIIEAEKNPKKYKVTLDIDEGETLPNGALFDENNNEYYVEVFYGEPYSLPQPEKQGHTFVKWLYNGQGLTSLTWNIAQNVELQAEFVQNKPEFFDVMFVLGDGKEDVVKTLNNGEKLTLNDIPALPTVVGYEYFWQINGETCSQEDLLELDETTTVVAVKIPKKYKFTYSVGENATIVNESIEVVYGTPVTFDTPSSSVGGIFKCWKLNGEVINGVYSAWNIDCSAENTLVAVWEYKVYIDTVHQVNLPINGLLYDEEKQLYYFVVEHGDCFSLDIELPTYIQSQSVRYDFVCWLLDNEEFNGCYVNEEIYITASWIEAKNGNGWSENR